jgi:DeoR/GlpR family transcriptional regulator of sugar metabolism
MLTEERRSIIAGAVRESGGVSVADLQERFGISAMTARRDLRALELRGVVRRTHGGAVLPGSASLEGAFAQRLETARAEKERLAQAFVATLGRGESLFVDCSSTAYYAVREILRERIPVTILTNAIPVMEVVGSQGDASVELFGFGGRLRPVSQSFVGPTTTAAIRGHLADRAVLSAYGVTSDGVLTDPDPLEADVKRAMIERARDSALLIDATKLETTALHVIAEASTLTRAFVAATTEQTAPLRRAGARVKTV